MTSDPFAGGPGDDELLEQMAAGDGLAFTTLFRRRQAQVYRFALHVTGSPSAAEDVTQEVFLTLIREAGRYEPGRSGVLAWLCGIARNHARRRLARDSRLVSLPETPEGDPEIDVDDDAPHPFDAMAHAEQVRDLHTALQTLPVHYREVIALCDLQEMNYVEAAAALECAVGTVRSRLHRGRALLAEKLRADPAGDTSGKRCLV
jgi:RNA polymerase sigma-70 factor (ECF subfamily)